MDQYHETTPPTKLKSAVMGGKRPRLGKRRVGVQKPVPKEVEELAEKIGMHEALKEAWQIINVLTLSHMDEGEPYPKALFWLKEWEHLEYKPPEIK